MDTNFSLNPLAPVIDDIKYYLYNWAIIIADILGIIAISNIF